MEILTVMLVCASGACLCLNQQKNVREGFCVGSSAVTVAVCNNKRTILYWEICIDGCHTVRLSGTPIHDEGCVWGWGCGVCGQLGTGCNTVRPSEPHIGIFGSY